MDAPEARKNGSISKEWAVDCDTLQAHVSAVQGQSFGPRQARQVHHAGRHRRRRRLPLQVPQLAVDGVRQG